VAQQAISVFAGFRNFVRVLWRAARELFHEITGALFFIIAASAIQSCWRAWRRGLGGWMIGMTAGYAVLMVVLGTLSFRDSRRVR